MIHEIKMQVIIDREEITGLVNREIHKVLTPNIIMKEKMINFREILIIKISKLILMKILRFTQ